MGLFKKKKVEEQKDTAEQKIIERQPEESTPQMEKKQAQMPEVPSEDDRLQQMSMPELWKIASSQGISKNGKKDELIERIQESQKTGMQTEYDEKDVLKTLEQLRKELGEYERIREKISTMIDSASGVLPRLNERKDLLERDINQEQQKISEVAELLPRLEEEKGNLQRSIQEKFEQKTLIEKEITERSGEITEINQLIPKLMKTKEDMQKDLKQKQEEIQKIDEQIKQIQNLQKYSTDTLSTILYEIKKNNE